MYSTANHANTQDVVMYLRGLKDRELYNQGGFLPGIADLVIKAASLGKSDQDYIVLVEWLAYVDGLTKLKVADRHDLFFEVMSRFDRQANDFRKAINDKKKAVKSAMNELMPDDERLMKMVEEMNCTHASTVMGGKNVIMRKVPDVHCDGRMVTEFIRPKELAGLYANDLYTVAYKQSGEPIRKDRITAWTAHKHCRSYPHGVYLLPIRPKVGGGEQDYQVVDGALNLWSGFAVEPAPGGDWSLIDWHIRNVLAGGNDEVYQYLLNWVAHTVQNPERQAGSAIVFRGGKRIGKGLFANFLKDLWGEHGFVTSNASHIVGKFNKHLMNTCLLFADEALLSGNKQHENVLKPLVTDRYATYEGKGIDVINSLNMLKIVMATNEDWAVPTDIADDRFCVCDVSDCMRGNRDYFNRLVAQMGDDGSRSAFLHDMLTRDISSWSYSDIPITEGLCQQREESLPSIWMWWLDCLAQEYVVDQSADGQLWFIDETAKRLHDSYLKWCEVMKVKPESRNKFGREFGKLYQRRPNSQGYTCYLVGTLDEARRVFQAAKGV